MAKLQFIYYNQSLAELFPSYLDEKIPKTLLKVVLYDYMNNIYSCRKITKMGNVANQYTFVWKGT